MDISLEKSAARSWTSQHFELEYIPQKCLKYFYEFFLDIKFLDICSWYHAYLSISLWIRAYLEKVLKYLFSALDRIIYGFPKNAKSTQLWHSALTNHRPLKEKNTLGLQQTKRYVWKDNFHIFHLAPGALKSPPVWSQWPFENHGPQRAMAKNVGYVHIQLVLILGHPSDEKRKKLLVFATLFVTSNS